MKGPFAPRRHDGSARRWLTAFVLLCVLCTQALGLVHGIVHASHAGTVRSAPPGQVALEDARGVGVAPAPGGLGALFASHDDSSECRLFDALGHQHGPALCAPALSYAQTPCIHLHRRLAGACVARWATLFDARGPPVLH
ncbi:hypothetical protein [Acidovorax sp. FJL06]|uniref:hypothetical protein n=1 Tax=Acidovorax sp. FJL06 TaxID=2153365 RepID=UPI000F573E01|nr:hypothetical protein [Acidovorax sp. FJL06]RQO79926.1 hypothetical protein DBV10_21075 [Acidovorax sp. FJL06]